MLGWSRDRARVSRDGVGARETTELRMRTRWTSLSEVSPTAAELLRRLDVARRAIRRLGVFPDGTIVGVNGAPTFRRSDYRWDVPEMPFTGTRNARTEHRSRRLPLSADRRLGARPPAGRVAQNVTP